MGLLLNCLCGITPFPNIFIRLLIITLAFLLSRVQPVIILILLKFIFYIVGVFLIVRLISILLIIRVLLIGSSISASPLIVLRIGTRSNQLFEGFGVLESFELFFISIINRFFLFLKDLPKQLMKILLLFLL